MVNVTKKNFIEQSNDLLHHLPTAAFVAVDEEMTGISLPGTPRPSKDETPNQRYPTLKKPAERYSIIQLGICLFHPPSTSSSTSDGAAADTEWHVRRYNFYMFPAAQPYGSGIPERDVVLNPSAVAFLHRHNMSFDLWSHQGIPFVDVTHMPTILERYIQKQQMDLLQQQQQEQAATVSPTVQETIRRRVELRRTDDIDFFGRAMANLREWLDAAHAPPSPPTAAPAQAPAAVGAPGGEPPAAAAPAAVQPNNDNADDGEEGEVVASEGMSFLLPPCNSFLRRALYEGIAKEYPSLELESAGPDYPNQIRVWRLTPAEKRVRLARLRREAWEEVIVQKLGMQRIFQALSRVCQGKELPRRSVLFASSYDQIDWEDPTVRDHSDEEEDDDDSASNQRRQVPLVVHNGTMDLLFLLSHFHDANLPETLPETKALIRQYFPVVYDTKVLSTEYSALWNHEMSNLSKLFQKVVCEHTTAPGATPLVDRIHVLPAAVGRGRGGGAPRPGALPHPDDDPNDPSLQDQEHEAAYDAYMTGAIYIGLCNDIRLTLEQASSGTDATSSESENADQADSTPPALTLLPDDDPDARTVGNLVHLSRTVPDDITRHLYGRNKLYQMSMYTMDLESPLEDPFGRGMIPQATYRVSGIDRLVATRDIVRCLDGISDESNRPVNFEIIWIDDTTFIVAASTGRRIPAVAPPLPPVAAAGGANADNNSSAAVDTELLTQHGGLLLEALRKRFPHETIICFDEFLRNLQETSAEGARGGVASNDSTKPESFWSSMVSRVSGLLGYNNSGADAGSSSSPPKKRRRLNE